MLAAPLSIVNGIPVGNHCANGDQLRSQGYRPDPPKFEPRFKKKGRSKSGHVEKRKRKIKDTALREKIRDDLIKKRDALAESTENISSLQQQPEVVKAASPASKPGSDSKPPSKKSVLDRFKTKKNQR